MSRKIFKNCHNLNFKLVTNKRVWKGKGMERCGPRMQFGSVRECDGMNPHTSKWTPTLGVGIPMEF
jgi:hypothetical protein